MKVSTLIALLKTYPQNANVSLLGTEHFYIYYYKNFQTNVNSVLLDTELLDDSDIEKTDNISLVQILDSKFINPSFEVDNSIDDDEVNLHKTLLKVLDDNDKKGSK